MGVYIKNHKLCIDIRLPLPYRYKGAGVALFRVINGKTEVLLGLRRNRPHKNKWTFPGGGVERNEKFSAAAVREFREEVGVQLYRRFMTRTGIYKIRMPFFSWNTYLIETTQTVPINNCIVKNNKIIKIINSEFYDLEWVGIDELENYKLHPFVKEVISIYKQGKMKRVNSIKNIKR